MLLKRKLIKATIQSAQKKLDSLGEEAVRLNKEEIDYIKRDLESFKEQYNGLAKNPPEELINNYISAFEEIDKSIGEIMAPSLYKKMNLSEKQK